MLEEGHDETHRRKETKNKKIYNDNVNGISEIAEQAAIIH